jgi:hypothetical protein
MIQRAASKFFKKSLALGPKVVKYLYGMYNILIIVIC